MNVRKLPRLTSPAAWREGAATLYRSRRLRRSLLVVLALVVLFGLLGFLAAPPLIKSQLESRASALLGRPVTVGAIRLNPYTLKLDLDRLHIGERDGASPFVDVDHLTVDASWGSLFRLKPVLSEVTLQHPQIRIARSAPQQFNFSDLIARFAAKPGEPPSPPTRFAVSNISVHEGDIRFDDQVLKTHHRVEHLELGIPFIANLPRASQVFVQPLLALSVDGSPLRVEGRTKPFADSLESSIGFHLDGLELPRYLGYVPTQLPVAIPRGRLSGDLELRFVQSQPQPQLQLGGTLTLDDFALTGRDGAAIAEVGHGTAALADVQPLLSRYRLGAVRLDHAAMHYVRTAGGHSNLDALTGGGAPAPATTTSPATATEVAIAELALSASRFDYTDASGEAPVSLALDGLAGSIKGLSTAAGSAAVDLGGQLAGGSVASRGRLDIAAGRYAGTLAIKNADLLPLQALAAAPVAATLRQGRLDADGSFQADWHAAFNLHLEPAKASLRDVAIGRRDDKASPIAWRSLDAELTRFDLAGSEARLGNLAVQGLKVEARRDRRGSFDLASLADSPPASRNPRTRLAAPPAKPAPTPAWHWSVARLTLADGALGLTDQTASGKPSRFKLDALKGQVEGLSDSQGKPLKLTLAGRLGKGGFDASGTVRPAPLDADLHIKTRQLDLAGFEPYATVPLNVNVTRALLTSDGRLRYAAHGDTPRMSYRGRATLGRVRVQDKLSGDDFARWNTLALGGVNLRLGEGAPRLSLGGIALSDFYARVIVNADGRLNLADVAGAGAAQPVSVTRAETTPAGHKETPAPATTSSAAAPAAAAPAAIIQIGRITLARGQLNYTDNFIKPNYTANITQLTGKVGAFGTRGGPPAEVALQGQLDDNSPVDIGGTINPLAPVAFLDIQGKATGVELTHLSAYSSKYTGYPIVKGRLNADVQYLLDQGKLKADNHIFIDQLTFGDRIESPGVSHLPVKLAVALLKNSRGEIDVRVPVSGSLDDPQFSLGGVIWHAFVNLIAKAATAPFRLLASAFGGGGGNNQDLGYVEFAAGSSVLDDTAKARLGQIVKALNERASLNLDITGRVDPAVDEKGLRQVMVDDRIRQERQEDVGDDDPAAAQAPLSPQDYDRYLERAYKHAKFPKPRNLIGLAKSQPPEDMKKMLEANMPVDQNALRQLAERRAEAVRSWLRGKIDDKRVFVLAPKLDAKGIDDQGKTSRADFGLH